MTIKVIVNGAAGKMGKCMTAGLLAEEDINIVAAVDTRLHGSDIGIITGNEPTGVKIEGDLITAIKRARPEVLVDFTNPQAIMKTLRSVVPMGVACVVGTTGLSAHDIKEVDKLAHQHQAPVFVAPNFALGAVLMMRFAAEAAEYFTHVEIIERHHDQKLDAPSGTALATMELIAEKRDVFSQGAANEYEKLPGARGGDFQGARIHSVRLPGYVATQEVVFGGVGQLLTIRHDAMSRDSFLPGLLIAVRKVLQLEGLVSGLENII